MRNVRKVMKALAISLSVLTVSCERRPLYYEYGPIAAVNIIPDWSEAGGVPKGCETFVYDRDGALIRTVLSKRTDTIRLELPPGTYQALTITYSESEYGSIDIAGKESLLDIRAESPEGAPAWRAPGMTRTTAAEPEWIASGLTNPFEVTEEEARSSLVLYHEYRKRINADGSYGFTARSVKDIPLRVRNDISDLEIEIWVSDIRKVRDARAVFGGMATGWSLSEDRPLDDTLGVSVERWRRHIEGLEAPGRLTASANCFGIPGRFPDPDTNPGSNVMTLYLSMGNGSVMHTASIETRPALTVTPDRTWVFRDTLRVRIGTRECPLELPDVPYDDGSSSFNAHVDDWDDQPEIIIPID